MTLGHAFMSQRLELGCWEAWGVWRKWPTLKKKKLKHLT